MSTQQGSSKPLVEYYKIQRGGRFGITVRTEEHENPNRHAISLFTLATGIAAVVILTTADPLGVTTVALAGVVIGGCLERLQWLNFWE